LRENAPSYLPAEGRRRSRRRGKRRIEAAEAVSGAFSSGEQMAVLSVGALFSDFIPTLNEEAGAKAAK
jgi:hypothetical protein